MNTHPSIHATFCTAWYILELGPEHTGHFVQPHVAAHCGGDIYSRRKPLFSSFGEHTAVCGSSVRQAVARPRHRQSVCIHNIHVAATCRPSVLGFATMRGHMWLNKVASVLGPLIYLYTYKTLITLIVCLFVCLFETVRSNPGYGMATLIYNNLLNLIPGTVILLRSS